MGMDVFGKKPAGPAGEYFRNNVWSWRPLADYVREVAPDITSACRFWDSNDGDGLNSERSRRLAEALESEINSGRTARYARLRTSRLEMMPNEPCDLCEGTGTRKPVAQRGAGDPKAGGVPCNGCGGSGHVRPRETNYYFDVDNVRAFAAFLKDCGGFGIC